MIHLKRLATSIFRWVFGKKVNCISVIRAEDWTSPLKLAVDCFVEIESLDPYALAKMKMLTVFNGPFTESDLASSTRSPWVGAHWLGNLRVFKACDALVNKRLLELYTEEREGGFMSALHEQTPLFILRNELVRRVGNRKWLQSIHRLVIRELPQKIAEKRSRNEKEYTWLRPFSAWSAWLEQPVA